MQLAADSPRNGRDVALTALYEYEATIADVETLYWAIGLDYYGDRQSGEVRSLLLSKLGEIKHTSTAGYIENAWSHLPPAAREMALSVLSEINTLESLGAWIRILVKFRPAFPLDNMNTEHIIRDPQHVSSIMGQLSDIVDNRHYRRGIYRIVASAVEKGYINCDSLRPLSKRVLGDTEESMRQFDRSKLGTSRQILSIEYATATVAIIGAMAASKDQRFITALRIASEHRDSQIAFAATCQLLRLGRDVDERQLERFMGEPTTRIEMYNQLKRIGRKCYCSAALLTQEAFAESDLARHLLIRNRYPPTNVRVVGSRECIVGRKRGRVYVLKFADRVLKSSGVIGLSGPWPLDGGLISHGELTFSANCNEKLMSVDEHFSELRRLARRREGTQK